MTIGFTVHDLATGFQRSATKMLREFANHLEEELEQVNDIYSKMNNLIEWTITNITFVFSCMIKHVIGLSTFVELSVLNAHSMTCTFIIT